MDEPLPDHSSLSRIRKRLGLPIFRRFFEHIVELCDQAGLVWGKELLFDATKVRANASLDSVVPRLREVVDDHLVALFGSDTEGAQIMEETAELSADELVASRWDLLEECRLDPNRPAAPGYQRLSDILVSRTDPDAALMRARPGTAQQVGYHDHYVVDGGKARIILHALVTPADVMENAPMLDQLRRVMFRYRLRPKRVIADTTYGTVENIVALEDMGIRPYVPLPDFDQRTPFFGASRFTYDAERDVYVCPHGETLVRKSRVFATRTIRYQAKATACNACPLKTQCTAGKEGRHLYRSFDEEYLDRVRQYHQSERYQRAMRKRKVWVEPLFGEAKQWHGLVQFRLRGLHKVNIQGLLIAAGQNLKRYLVARGWGRRDGPSGSLLCRSRVPDPVLLPL